MYTLSGGCHCGRIRVEIGLTQAPSTYRPRACDCGFCHKHGAAYVSDSHGSMLVQATTSGDIATYRQGSGAAEFLFCRQCGILISVTCQIGGKLHAAVNARVLDLRRAFRPQIEVSPQQLSAADKLKRWQELWFADVTLRVEETVP